LVKFVFLFMLIFLREGFLAGIEYSCFQTSLVSFLEGERCSNGCISIEHLPRVVESHHHSFKL
jgi:hypothetical protein